MLKVLILGADGFIGNSLIRRILANTDWQVVGLDLWANRLAPILDHPRFSFHQGDLTVCRDWIDQQIRACDVVLPLAACARPIEYVRDPLGIFELDFEENLRIVRQCFQSGTRVIFPSTSEVYGMCSDEYFNEETSPLVLGPISKERWMYSCGKQMLDRVIWAYGSKGLQFTLFRPFNWFGPNLDDIKTSAKGSARVITQFLGHLLRGEPISLVDGGRQRRCFTYIDDGIDILMEIIKNPGGVADGRIFNVGNPENEFSIAELAHLMVNTLAEFPGWQEIRETAEVQMVPATDYYGEGYQDVQARRPDISLGRSLLGWEPKVLMQQGLTRTIAFYLERDFQSATLLDSSQTLSTSELHPEEFSSSAVAAPVI